MSPPLALRASLGNLASQVFLYQPVAKSISIASGVLAPARAPRVAGQPASQVFLYQPVAISLSIACGAFWFPGT